MEIPEIDYMCSLQHHEYSLFMALVMNTFSMKSVIFKKIHDSEVSYKIYFTLYIDRIGISDSTDA